MLGFLIKLIAFVAVYFAELLVPFYPGRRMIWAHDLRNVIMGAINIAAMSVLTLYITNALRESTWGVLNWTNLPVLLEYILAFLTLDLYIYLWHRLNHRIKFLWRFHRVHHTDLSVDASSAFRFHIVEVALSMVGRLALIALLGIPALLVFIFEAVFSSVVYFHHSNIGITERADRLLRTIIPSPHMHRVHHSVKRVETDSNYGSVLSIWDRLFGSFRLVGNPMAIVQGLEEHRDPGSQTLVGMMKTPFV